MITVSLSRQPMIDALQQLSFVLLRCPDIIYIYRMQGDDVI